MSNVGKGKNGSAIKLADVQHLGKRADAPGMNDPEFVKLLANPNASKGPSVRRIFRRNKRRLTALDYRVHTTAEKSGGHKLYSKGKNVKRLQQRFVKYLRQTRLLTGLLIRATGAAAPSLIAHEAYVMPAYKRRIAEVGTSISKPNLTAREDHANV